MHGYWKYLRASCLCLWCWWIENLTAWEVWSRLSQLKCRRPLKKQKQLFQTLAFICEQHHIRSKLKKDEEVKKDNSLMIVSPASSVQLTTSWTLLLIYLHVRGTFLSCTTKTSAFAKFTVVTDLWNVRSSRYCLYHCAYVGKLFWTSRLVQYTIWMLSHPQVSI